MKHKNHKLLPKHGTVTGGSWPFTFTASLSLRTKLLCMHLFLMRKLDLNLIVCLIALVTSDRNKSWARDLTVERQQVFKYLSFSCLDYLWCRFPKHGNRPYWKKETLQNGILRSLKGPNPHCIYGVVRKVIAGLQLAHSWCFVWWQKSAESQLFDVSGDLKRVAEWNWVWGPGFWHTHIPICCCSENRLCIHCWCCECKYVSVSTGVP